MSEKRIIPYKLVLLGESAVGKSSLVLRFVRGEFFEFQESTIGAAFLTQTIPLENGTTVKFDIWDTAGQERYKSLAPMYYRGAPAAIVVYDITSIESYQKAKSWVSELVRQGTNVTIGLAGNKQDLEDRRKVEAMEARAYCDEKGILFFETSAKTGKNVSELFVNIARELPKEKLNDEHAEESIRSIIPSVDEEEDNDVGGGCC